MNYRDMQDFLNMLFWALVLTGIIGGVAFWAWLTWMCPGIYGHC